MSQTAKKKGLGKGLSALLGDMPAQRTGAEMQQGTQEALAKNILPVAYLERNEKQPRRLFDDQALADLAHSIKEQGLLQPILVREMGQNRYQIVAGERRWRAAQLAGLQEVPVVIHSLTDDETLQIAIIENIQRENLSPIEEAEAYQRLINEFSYTQEKISELVGKSRSHIANLLRLLGLPAMLQKMVDAGLLTMGHARALIGAEQAQNIAEKIVSEGLSVRQTEELVGLTKNKQRREPRPGGNKAQNKKIEALKDADTIALEKDLSEATGAKVAINHLADGSGILVLHYNDIEQLDALCGQLGVCGVA